MSKICPQCGNELPDSAKFCNTCGTSMESVAPIQKEEQTYYNQAFQTQETENAVANKTQLLIDPSEKIVAELKNSVAQNILVGNGLSRNTTFFTNERLYYQDKTLSFRGLGKTTQDLVVNLKDISATNVVNRNPIIFLILGVLFTIIVTITTAHTSTLGAFLNLIFWGVVVAISYFTMKTTYIQVFFPGGVARLSVKMYSYADVRTFHKLLRQNINQSK